MTSVFYTGQEESDFPTKVLFLHGLEGSSTGSKANHLKNLWGAKCPPLRTHELVKLKKSSLKGWLELDLTDIENSMSDAVADAKDAIRYFQPDIIVGSSMGAAVLFKLCLDKTINTDKTSCVFLAPAIYELVRPKKKINLENSVWVFAELDEAVNNRENFNICQNCGGTPVFSKSDTHRLQKALAAGLIDNSILTLITKKEYSIFE